MEQLKIFESEKTAVVASLDQLQQIVNKLTAAGLDVSEDVEKIKLAIASIETDALKIALLGAFSDGKTSVIAGWLGHVMTDMKIDTNESSNEICVYQPSNLPLKCEIVDTPGLFGDKESSDKQGNVIVYSDITKKYISEAHLIFYVVDATNPLKDSHNQTVRWVLRNLNKLSSTIFIINKMDEVADLRDQVDFEEQAKIKKCVLLERLTRFVELTEVEKQQVNVVCIASNPNGRGFDFWFDRRDDYENRSNMGELKCVTEKILSATERRQKLISKTGMDVIKDVLARKVNIAEDEFLKVELIAKRIKAESLNLKEDLSRGRESVIGAKIELFEQLNNLEKRLLGQLRGLSREDINNFLEDEIGILDKDVGYKLRLKIEMACQSCFTDARNVMADVGASFERQLTATSKFAETISSSAISASTKALDAIGKMPVEEIKASVFAARDALASLTNFTFKFKPWQASKIADFVGKWAGPVGAGISIVSEVFSLARKKQDEDELASFKKDLTDMIKDHFSSVYHIFESDERVFEVFAPALKEYEKILTQQAEDLAALDRSRDLLKIVKHDLLEIDAVVVAPRPATMNLN